MKWVSMIVSVALFGFITIVVIVGAALDEDYRRADPDLWDDFEETKR